MQKAKIASSELESAEWIVMSMLTMSKKEKNNEAVSRYSGRKGFFMIIYI
jgi:hypothetical protein